MNERTSAGADAPDATPHSRTWAFIMDGYLPPADTVNPDAPPTAADLAFDRLVVRLAGLRRGFLTSLPFAGLRTRRARQEGTE